MDVREFDFALPSELIAQAPAADRSAGRLLHLHRDGGSITHTQVSALPDLLRAGDLVVVNNTRVFPARLLGHRVPSGGAVECLLLGRVPSGLPSVPGPGARYRCQVPVPGTGARLWGQTPGRSLGGVGAPGAEIEAGGAGRV